MLHEPFIVASRHPWSYRLQPIVTTFTRDFRTRQRLKAAKLSCDEDYPVFLSCVHRMRKINCKPPSAVIRFPPTRTRDVSNPEVLTRGKGPNKTISGNAGRGILVYGFGDFISRVLNVRHDGHCGFLRQ